MGKYKQKLNRTRQNFLLSFFDSKPEKQVQEVNGFILVKYHDNNIHQWGVMIYTKDSYDKYLHPLQSGDEAGQTSPKSPEKQLEFPCDGGRLRTLHDASDLESDNRLPWETEGETDNR